MSVAEAGRPPRLGPLVRDRGVGTGIEAPVPGAGRSAGDALTDKNDMFCVSRARAPIFYFLVIKALVVQIAMPLVLA